MKNSTYEQTHSETLTIADKTDAAVNTGTFAPDVRRNLLPRIFPVALVLLAACGSPSIPIESAPVAARYAQDFNQDRVAGAGEIVVRTYIGEGRTRQEVAGAECRMESDAFSADFVSPVKVRVPTFVQRRQLEARGRPDSLRIACTTGEAQGIVTITAEDKEISTATNAGVAGAILTTVVSGALAGSTPWRYASSVSVQLIGAQ
ncbi:hypothetical protein L0664_06845 [Octadecabacter sp. G9-8]|uniref:TonB C-terminal domain-containing protein n=1 Tax=Octadecabacter dasysiphoniae TaxID=2909341 RepID=A0ABS9CWL1_9RHOB|nr:hypothetical protein [Octadecabacter dasysiphoniae]MCF2870779.1 hypothetical protein [Octadecabacter dasysiphoniae]